MKQKYYIISAIILAVIVILIIFINLKNENEDIKNIVNNEVENISNLDENEIQNMIEEITVDNENIDEIKNIQNQINSTANPNIYYIDEEYDGRKILQIKPEIQYEVDLAGILKNAKPEESELDELLQNAPTKTGIWISEQSRTKFLELLNENNINSFTISSDGYLEALEGGSNNDSANKLKEMISSGKLYIINMAGTAYERDYISGEIVEYPFEEMDPYQILQPYETKSKIILEITSNKNNKLSATEILETIIAYE